MGENVRHFAVCVRNDEHEESLELRKIYEVVADDAAAAHHLIRVVDEGGEDYLYPRDWFLAIELPHNIEEALRQMSRS